MTSRFGPGADHPPTDGPRAEADDRDDPYDDATLAALLGLDALDEARPEGEPPADEELITITDDAGGADDEPSRSGPRPSDRSQPPQPPLAGVVGAALARRAAGQPTGPWAAEPIGPVDAFRRTLDELALLVGRLDPGDWDAPTPWASEGWQVRDMVAHLVGVERYTASLLGAGAFAVPDGLEADHLAVTGPTVAELRDLLPAALAARWRAAVDAAISAVEAAAQRGRGLDQPMSFHLLPMRLRTFLVVRVFEVWTHTDDIRRAIGEAPQAPDGARLRLMSETAVEALPLGMAIAGRAHPGRTARVVLTGAGGGAWSQSLNLGEPVGEPSALIVADVVDFCRLAARRLDAGELPCVIEGDASLAADVLVGAAIFAA